MHLEACKFNEEQYVGRMKQIGKNQVLQSRNTEIKEWRTFATPSKEVNIFHVSVPTSKNGYWGKS